MRFCLIALFLFLFFTSAGILAKQQDYQLNIHAHYDKENDSWRVQYELPIAIDHIAFSRRSNFDRRNFFDIDLEKYHWDMSDDILLIRSNNGKKFKNLELNFKSRYDFILKDYALNVSFSDNSLMLYTDHLTLGANII